MRRLPIGTLALVGALLLSGCASDSQPPPTGKVIEDPLDYSEPASTHQHDYWNGQSEVELVRYRGANGGATYSGETAPLDIVSFDEGVVVLQGTGLIEATVSWRLDDLSIPPGDANRFTRIEFWAKTALDSQTHLMQAVDNGVAFQFPVTADEADPPHALLSLWQFQMVAVNEGGDSTRFSGSFDIEAKAIRTLPLRDYPPHPDLWRGSNEVWLKDVDGGAALHIGIGPNPAGVPVVCIGGTCADYTFTPEAGIVVPYDAATVEVSMTLSPESTPLPLTIEVHGADTRRMTAMSVYSQTANEAVFQLTLSPGMGDSPYATQSLWEFRIHIDTPNSAGAWSGDSNLRARALRS